jgi:RNA polymerase I-specific transcription initiation factor RRN3
MEGDITWTFPIAHGVFLFACQAVMYALYFRLKDLTRDHKLKHVLRNLSLQELVEHHLKPLTVCLPFVWLRSFVKQAS